MTAVTAAEPDTRALPANRFEKSQRRGVPPSALLAGMLVLLAAQNLLLWSFLGFESILMFGSGFAAILYIGWAAAKGWTAEPGAHVSYRLLLVCASLATLLLLLGGEGGIFYRNFDWQIRDAVLRDLSVGSWPFVYVERGATELLRAPLGMYLIPAATAKLFGPRAADVMLLVQNASLLTVLFALAARLFETDRQRVLAVVIFIMFSGIDLLGTLLLHGGDSLPPLDHIEGWAGIQYSSHITQLFWVPQHALAGWAGALLFLLWKQDLVKVGLLLLAVPILASWSPLAAMGVLPFAAYAGAADLLRRRVAFPDILAPAVATILTIPSLLYMASGGEGVGARVYEVAPVQYSIFTILEVIPYLAGVLILTPRPRLGQLTLMTVGACLLLMPFLQIGESFDFMMRASIPALAILAVMVTDALLRAGSGNLALLQRLALPALFAAMALGAVTPLLELRRAVAFKPPPPIMCNMITAMNQAVWLAHTTSATYLTPLERVPAAIRPADPSPLLDPPNAICWERPWQVSR
jgi:hypothetical protein